MAIEVSIVSAENAIFSGEADLVVATALYGELGIRQKHTPLLAFLRPGEVRLAYDSEEEAPKMFYISGGFIEVQPDLVTILADTAIRADDIDEAAAIEAEKRARVELEHHKSDMNFANELAQIAQATAQLNLLRKLRKELR